MKQVLTKQHPQNGSQVPPLYADLHADFCSFLSFFLSRRALGSACVKQCVGLHLLRPSPFSPPAPLLSLCFSSARQRRKFFFSGRPLAPKSAPGSCPHPHQRLPPCLPRRPTGHDVRLAAQCNGNEHHPGSTGCCTALGQSRGCSGICVQDADGGDIYYYYSRVLFLI